MLISYSLQISFIYSEIFSNSMAGYAGICQPYALIMGFKIEGLFFILLTQFKNLSMNMNLTSHSGSQRVKTEQKCFDSKEEFVDIQDD